MKYLFTFIFSFLRSGIERKALSSSTQHEMPPEIGGMWGTECLNTRFPLPILQCAVYIVKLLYDLYGNYNVLKYKLLNAMKVVNNII